MRGLSAPNPRCFGAASRDQVHPCHNPALRLLVRPTPDDALILPNAPCRPKRENAALLLCVFGVASDAARETVALVGDSHASHWRGTLDFVAKQRGWAAVSLAHSGCPFSEATPDLPAGARARCIAWNQAARQWFTEHPEVSTVFASAHAGARIVPRRGRSAASEQQRGYRRAWSALPATVKRTVVIHDVPASVGAEADCVRRAIRARRPAGEACAVPRAGALRVDREARAASSLRGGRVRLVDLTPFMCSTRQCFPVVGGALVLKDQNHLTSVFAATLGPYLARATRRALGGG